MRREPTSKLDSTLRTIWIVIVIVTGIPALVPSCAPGRPARADGAEPERLVGAARADIRPVAAAPARLVD